MAYTLSGQTTVTTAGTAVRLHASARANTVTIKALDGNTGLVYVGNDGAGDVTASNGYELSGGQSVVFHLPNETLADIWVDSAENGDKVCWAASILEPEDR